ncbi:MAG TPA: hypothetical protein PLH19_03035 [Anaerolineae bacterium]|nr:hypothetical protein [Anaerolineae bacterium]HQH37495.1 hypothetical protein [Anaerolineae bacterium]
MQQSAAWSLPSPKRQNRVVDAGVKIAALHKAQIKRHELRLAVKRYGKLTVLPTRLVH